MMLALIVLLPLVASVIQLLVGRSLPRRGDWLPTGALLASWVMAMELFIPVFFMGKPVPPDLSLSFDWAVMPDSAWTLGIMADPLSLVMVAMVTTVSLLIHIFSSGYMKENPLFARFFAYIGFFTFAMLGLVVSDNLLFLFICWELMGLCSYLLIGFYSWCPECGYDRESPYRAATKAFLTTRVGDVGLFVGIAVLYGATGQLTFHGISEAIHAGVVSRTAQLVAALLILSGAIGKSAQFPLHVWLPDAMEGPSPVSALIHAATMVAAGVYLVGRSIAFGFFPPEALVVTALAGSFTALFAATMALAAMDFKKVLAYSTISQLGYMFAGMAAGGFSAGFFHLITHSFFKALLFLGSGAVLHAVHTRDMREMGGLHKKMPITFWTMMAGSLALAGFPGMAGFFSKDAVLAATLGWGMKHGGAHYLPFAFLIMATGLTAFYTFRMMIMVFNGKPLDRHRYDHAHEAEPSMTVPLVILAVFAVSVGWGWFKTPFEHLVTMPHAAAGSHGAYSAHIIAMVVSIITGLGGIGLAYAVYFFHWIKPEVFTAGPLRRAIHTTLLRLYWIDDLYMLLVRKVIGLAMGLGSFDREVIDRTVDSTAPALVMTSIAAERADMKGVDGIVNGIADMTQSSGEGVRSLQTGRIQDYALALMGAVILLVIWVSI